MTTQPDQTPPAEPPLPGSRIHVFGPSNPTVVMHEDRVRVTSRTSGHSYTGVYKRLPRVAGDSVAHVQRDDDGDTVPLNAELDELEVLYFDRAKPDVERMLPVAAVILRSAWLPTRDLLPMFSGPREPLTDDELAERAEYLKRRDGQRLCHCGQVATARAVAWSESEDVDLAELDAGVSWMDVHELGDETVCSNGCALDWARKFLAEAVLPPSMAVRFRFEENFMYQPEFDELPLRLGQARGAAARAVNVLESACHAHVMGDSTTAWRMARAVRANIAQLLDAVLRLPDTLR